MSGEMRPPRWPLGMIVPVQDPTPFSPFSPGEWKRALPQLVQAGYQVVELAVTDPAPLEGAEVAAAVGAAGLRLCSLTTGQAAAKEGLSLSAEEEAMRERAVERICAHMRLAKPHGAVVIVGSLRGQAGSPGLLVDSLRACAAFDRSVRLALEPLNRYESRLVNTVADALTVVERVGADNLGLLVDTFHANIEERLIGDAFRAAGDRLFHVHLADSNRWPPGQGHLSFSEVAGALAASGYAGALVVEAFPKPDPAAALALPHSAGRWFAPG
ncbi:MAG: TIM barrel protein [Candidatus Bipolaricaulaceae bacterium]